MLAVKAQSDELNPSGYSFKPPLVLRPALVQTGLASLKFRAAGNCLMRDAAQDLIVDAGDGVRLKASYSAHPHARGTVIFLHGWEGSQDSTYVLSCGRSIYDAGYNVFRLNYRDHGGSHYLNQGLFYAGRFAEVFEAVKCAAGLEPALPLHIIGFSLGGNFALRVVREARYHPIDNLGHVFSISPVIDPNNASPEVDKRRIIQRYFLRKWSTSLRIKQAYFPNLYDFSDVLLQQTIMGMTNRLIEKYMNFQSRKDFFDAYRIWPDDLLAANTPTAIIMAKHDPVLPAEDIWTLNLPSHIERIMLNYGGHNGFFSSLSGPTWYDNYVLDKLANFKH